jgi:hypothetical protein
MAFSLQKGTSVKVVGLKELRRDLRKIDPKLQKELGVATKRAAEFIAKDARDRVPQQTGRTSKSIRVTLGGKHYGRVATNSAFIVGGKKQVPFYGWLDFGSRTPVRGQPRSVGPWKGSGQGPSKGRFIYPAIAKNIGRFQKELSKAIEQVKRSAGLS